MKRSKKIILIMVAVVLIAAAAGIVTAALFYNGILKFNNPSATEYPVRGVDVSRYQGEIDWDILAGQGIDFAFIKATEGSTFVDSCFENNYKNAIQTNLRVGAYHFFSFDSPGMTQAQNFTNTVYPYDGILPPVVDVELYGKYVSNPPEDPAAIKEELRILLTELEKAYGVAPILYATYESYELFIAYEFSDYGDVFRSPKLPDGIEWTFWQYSNRGRLSGYSGEERFIDLNVFHGTLEEFQGYGRISE